MAKRNETKDTRQDLDDRRWVDGESPAGNADFAWVQHFIHHLAPMFHRILAGTMSSRTLSALRDTQLPKLISGELRTKDAGRIAGGAI